MQTTGQQLREIEQRLENHRMKKGSILAPDGRKWRDTLFMLEDEFHLLKLKALTERGNEIEGAKARLIAEYEKLRKRR